MWFFLHSWEPWDPRAGGDGLGPMYNDTSCAACHALPSAGGAGDRAHNTQLEVSSSGAKVVHRFSTLGEVEGGRTLSRNTPPLWGVGLLDTIPDEARALVALAQQRLEGPVSGRLPDGRFGWRGDSPTLAQFVATACAVELGLSVPGQPQSHPPNLELWTRKSIVDNAQKALLQRLGQTLPDGPDLSEGDLAELTAYVASLPRPVEQTRRLGYREGREHFEAVGCEVCHVRMLGEVEGLYSDLLLHDMGPGLSDRSVTYYGMPEPEGTQASASEWRTPPLWGVGSSAPYLHDGRADSMEEAIEAHGGEAQDSVEAWRALTELQKMELLAFLKSLVAPGS